MSIKNRGGRQRGGGGRHIRINDDECQALCGGNKEISFLGSDIWKKRDKLRAPFYFFSRNLSLKVIINDDGLQSSLCASLPNGGKISKPFSGEEKLHSKLKKMKKKKKVCTIFPQVLLLRASFLLYKRYPSKKRKTLINLMGSSIFTHLALRSGFQVLNSLTERPLLNLFLPLIQESCWILGRDWNLESLESGLKWLVFKFRGLDLDIGKTITLISFQWKRRACTKP